MTVENAQYIHELVTSNPPSTDFVLEGDNHLRLIKFCLQSQWPEAITAPIFNAKESDPLDDIESGDELLWSPAALAAWIKANWDALKGTPTVSDLSFSVYMDDVGQLYCPSGPFDIPFPNIKWAEGVYDTDNYLWTPGEAGTYWLHGIISGDPSQNNLPSHTRLEIVQNDPTNGDVVVAQDSAEYELNGQTFQHQVSKLVRFTDPATNFRLRSNNTGDYTGIQTPETRTYFEGYKTGSIAPATA